MIFYPTCKQSFIDQEDQRHPDRFLYSFTIEGQGTDFFFALLPFTLQLRDEI